MDSLLKELPISATFQIANTKSITRKMLWTALFSLSIILAIYHTVTMTLAYFKFSVIETATTDINIESPVVTICVNIPSKKRDDLFITPDMMAIFDKISSFSPECNTTIPSLFCLSLITSKERFAIGYDPVYQATHSLEFHYSKARTSYFLRFNNLYYGNCATIGSTNLSYIFRAYVSVVGYHLRPKFEPFSIAVFHGENLSPVFAPEDVFRSSAKGQNLIYVTKTEYKRKPWPYESMCIDEQTHPTRSWIIADRKNTNITEFKYSRRFCLDQCVHNLTAKYCKCILPKSLIDVNVDRLPLCTNRCGKIPEDQLKEMCNCRKECKSTHYKFDNCLTYPTENDELFQSFWAKLKWNLPMLENYRLGQLDYDSLSKTPSVVDHRVKDYTRLIVLTNRVLEVVTETAELELEALLSNIGGIWGLWIGISTLTLLEVISKLIKGKCHLKALQSHKFKIKLNEFIWTFIKLLSATVATWQAYITLMDYLEYNVIRVSTTVSREKPIFPSVTICSNAFVKYKEESFPMNSTMRRLFTSWNNANESDKKLYHDQFVEYFYYETDESQKYLLAPSVEDFVTLCNYETANGNHYDCMDKLVEFKVPYQNGISKTCTHLNPKLLRSNTSTEIYPRDLFIKLESVFDVLLLSRWSVLDVSIHAPGTAPFLNPNEHIVITPGDHVDVKFSTKQFKRLPHPYTSDCVDEESDSAVWLNNYYDANSHHSYRYKIESCLQSCIINASFNNMGCYILTTMNSYLMREAIRKQVDENGDVGYTLNPCVDDAPVMQDVFGNGTMCGCKQSCRSVLYELTMQRTPFAYKKKTKFDYDDHNYKLIERLDTGASGIRIRPASREIQMVTEVPKIESFSLVGLIGGVFGLWIGISIISFVETLYSSASTLIDKICHRKTKNTK